MFDNKLFIILINNPNTQIMKNFLLSLAMILFLHFNAQVGINTTEPSTTLEIVGKSPNTKVEGLIIPKFTGDEIFNMPIESTTTNEANLVYATSAASVPNQTGKGENLKGKGFFYWDDTLKKWFSVDNSTTTINNLLAFVKPMNILMGDNDGYVYPTNAFVAPGSPGLKMMDASFTTGGADLMVINNPLSGPPNNFQIWDNTAKLIKVPQQLLGYSITINISLKYPQTTSNADASRFVAFTGNTVVNTTNGTYSGGQKLKDLMFTKTKTSGFSTVRDELVLSPIIVTQDVIDFGIKLYLGSADGSNVSFYEPVLTIDYGVVNTTL